MDDAREADNTAPGDENWGEDEEEGENEESEGDGSARNNRLFDGEPVGISLRRGATTNGRCRGDGVWSRASDGLKASAEMRPSTQRGRIRSDHHIAAEEYDDM